MKRIIVIIGLVLFFYIQPEYFRFLLADEKKPNLLFIMCDQYRQDVMGAYGNKIIKTPNLDKLAEEGIRFNYFYISSYPCSPSRAVFLTGLYPQSNGVIWNNFVLKPGVSTLGSILKEFGYETVWIGKWHLSGPEKVIFDEKGKIIGVEKAKANEITDPLKVGFDIYVAGNKDYIDYLHKVGFTNINYKYPQKDGHSLIPEEHFITTYYVNQAIEYLNNWKKYKSNKPFALCVSIEGPHRPVNPPQPWDKMYPLESIKLPDNFFDPMKNKPKLHVDFVFRMLGKKIDEAEREKLKKAIVYENEFWDLFDRPEWTEKEFKEWISHYYGYVSSIDKQIGRLLDTLDSLGLKNNTIVVFTSDHGDYVGSHGMIDKSIAAYEELMKIPFIIRYPGVIKGGSKSDALISNVDFLPTILDLMGIQKPEGLEGKSFIKVILGETDKHRDAVFTTINAMKGRGNKLRMIRTNKWKYVLNWEPRDIDELYDLEKDPGELNNLIFEPKYKPIIEELRMKLFKWMEETKDPYLEEAKKASEIEIIKIDKINFSFDKKEERNCWTPYLGLTELKVENGKLVGKIITPGYMICEFSDYIKGDDYPVISIRMKTTAGKNAKIYWITKDSPKWDEKKSISFPINSNGEFHNYNIELWKNENWRGKEIKAIRLNPIWDKETNGQIEIDWIKKVDKNSN